MKLKYIFQFDVIGFEREKILLPPLPPMMFCYVRSLLLYFPSTHSFVVELTCCDSFDAKRDVIISYYSQECSISE